MTFQKHSACLRTTALMCAAVIAPGGFPVLAQEQPPATADEKPKLKSGDQLDSMVAPIALYPDPLLAQVLAASTYPLEIVQAQRWLKANPKLTGEALTKEAAKQPWDASVQALVGFPQALKLLDENVQWTTELGNAFLDQQGDVMDSIQRMRKKAKDTGKLQTTKEQKVEEKTIEQKTVVEIQPANPQVIYVPSYNPTVVYGAAPVYAYPPVAYPPPPPAGYYAATAAVSFGVGVMMGAMWSGCCGGGYGWGMGWGGNNVTINNNFNTRYGYNNINNIQGGNRTNVGNGNRGGNSWQHNPQHRGAVPYGNRNTAQRFGGAARDSAGASQRFDRGGQARNTGVADRGGENRNGAVADRGGQGRDGGAADRGSNNRGQASTRDAGANRGQSGAGGNQDRIGNRSVGADSGRQSALSGSQSRARTEAASSRGFSSSRQSAGGASSRSAGGGGSARSSGRSRGGGRRR